MKMRVSTTATPHRPGSRSNQSRDRKWRSVAQRRHQKQGAAERHGLSRDAVTNADSSERSRKRREFILDAEEIFEQPETGLGQHRLRMKLHALDAQFPVAQAHDRAVVRFGGNFERRAAAISARRSANDSAWPEISAADREKSSCRRDRCGSFCRASVCARESRARQTPRRSPDVPGKRPESEFSPRSAESAGC